MIRQDSNEIFGEDEEYQYPSQSDSETDKWVTCIEVSKGTEMKRVWKSVHDDPLNQELCESVKESEEHSPKNNPHPHQQKENYDPDDFKMFQVAETKRLRTPKFTLRCKVPQNMESSGDTKQQPEVEPGHFEKLKKVSSFTEVRSLSCLTKSKVNFKDIITDNEYSTNARIYQISTEVVRSTKMQRVTEVDNSAELKNMEKDRVLEWVTPQQNSGMECSKGLDKGMGCRGGDFSMEEDNLKEVSKVAMKRYLKSDSIEGGQHPVEEVKEFTVPPFDASVLNTVKKTVKSIRTDVNGNVRKFPKKVGGKSKVSFKKSKDKESSSEEHIPANFRDISFHYQPKDDNFQDMKPTGFSINFDYTSLKRKYSHGKVSTYFPGTKVKPPDDGKCDITPVPNYLLEFQGKSEDCPGKHEQYQMETLKPPTPCQNVSNISMVPEVSSVPKLEALNPSQYEFEEEAIGYSEDQAGSAVGGVERRNGTMWKVTRNKEMAEFGRQVMHLVEKNNHSDEPPDSAKEFFHVVEPSLPPLFPNRLPSNTENPMWIESSLLCTKRSRDHPLTRSNRTLTPNRQGRSLSRNRGQGNLLLVNRKSSSSTSRPNLRPGSRSKDYLPPRPRDDAFWDTWKSTVQGKPKVVSKVARWKGSNVTTKSSVNRVSSNSSSHKSLSESRESSRSSLRNFVRENIDKLRVSTVIKMPKDERPPLPKAGSRASSSVGKVSSEPLKGSKSVPKPLKIIVETTPKASVFKQVKAKASPVPPKKTAATKPNIKGQSFLAPIQEPVSLPGLLTPSIPDTPTTLVETASLPQGSDVKPKPNVKKQKAPVPKARKLKRAVPVVVPDPYYMQATPSEKELIDELVKADIDALLDREASKSGTSNEEVDKLSRDGATGSALSSSGASSGPGKSAGAHWAHGTHTQRGYPYPQASSKPKAKRPPTSTKERKTSGAGEVGNVGQKKNDSVLKPSVKPKANNKK